MVKVYSNKPASRILNKQLDWSISLCIFLRIYLKHGNDSYGNDKASGNTVREMTVDKKGLESIKKDLANHRLSNLGG